MFKEGLLKPTKTRKVYMYDLQGNFIREFDAEIEAARFLKVHRSQVEKNLTGENRRCHEYVFRYNYTPTISPYKKIRIEEKRYKSIHVYNEQEDYIFKSAKECSEYFHVHLVYIRQAIKDHRHFKRKYTIEYITAR